MSTLTNADGLLTMDSSMQRRFLYFRPVIAPKIYYISKSILKIHLLLSKYKEIINNDPKGFHKFKT